MTSQWLCNYHIITTEWLYSWLTYRGCWKTQMWYTEWPLSPHVQCRHIITPCSFKTLQMLDWTSICLERVPRFNSLLYFWIPASCWWTLGECLGATHWFLAFAWPRSDSCGYLGSKAADRRSLVVCLCLSMSLFSLPFNLYLCLCFSAFQISIHLHYSKALISGSGLQHFWNFMFLNPIIVVVVVIIIQEAARQKEKLLSPGTFLKCPLQDQVKTRNQKIQS